MYDKTTIVGHVGRSAEMRYTPSGKAVTSFTVAVNKTYTDTNGEQIKQTKWFTVTTWGKLAEVCSQYVTKGLKILVEGELSADPATGGPRVWNRKDGSAGSTFEMVAGVVRFLSPVSAHQNREDRQPDFAPEDEIPF